MEISEIKARLPLASVLARYGLSAQAGRMRCPFHDDQSPSFHVYPESGRWHCFAEGCRAHGGGDAIDFIRLKEGCTPGEAIRLAKQWATGEPAPAAAAKPEAPSVALEVRRAVLSQLMGRFRRSLAQSGAAGRYLGSRGLTAAGTGAGYNGARWTESETETMTAHLRRLGAITQKGRAFAARCLILPLVDEAGDVVSFYGRSILPNARAKHFYLRDRQGLYPAYPAAGTQARATTTRRLRGGCRSIRWRRASRATRPTTTSWAIR
jgi:DNA primase